MLSLMRLTTDQVRLWGDHHHDHNYGEDEEARVGLEQTQQVMRSHFYSILVFTSYNTI